MPEFGSLAALQRWLDEHHNREVRPTPFDLETCHRLNAALGDPQLAFAVIQVAGTKGKGSTSAALASLLDSAGLRVGLYTSPHLVDVRERIRVGGGPAADAAWLSAAERVRSVADSPDWSGPSPSWFELLTAIAWEVFRSEQVEVVVAEVGLGGRLDATSCCRPSLSVITRIGRDHVAILGDTIEEIAGEKAAILRPDVPAVAGPERPEAVAVVKARALAVGAPLWLLDHEVQAVGPQLETPIGAFPFAESGPLARNRALAVAGAARFLAQRGSPLDPEQIRPALERLSWRGRFDALDGPPPILIDGAHQVDAIALLRQCYAACHGEQPFVLLLALAEDKERGPLLDALAPGCAVAICCRGGQPRATNPEALAAGLRDRGVEAQASGDEVAVALERARAIARERGSPLVVTGSLYLAGAVLAALGEDVARAWA